VQQDKALDTERPAGRRSLSPRVVTSLLAAAVAAPSQHNTQPWRFRVPRYAHVIELYAEPARALPHSDPAGRAIHIACGAALLNLRLAAASPLTQPLETADAWLVRDPRSGHEQPQMILRIGYGLPVPPTPRRPVSQVLN
jgi:nitroreductase